MTRSIHTNLAGLFLVLVPAVPACAITDIAGGVDAGAGGGQVGVGTGGASATVGGQKGAGGNPSTMGAGGNASTKITGGTSSTMGAGGNTPTKGTGGTSTSGQLPIDCSGTAPTALPAWATANGCATGNETADFIGVWEGYIQGSQIGDESSTIRLTIVGANSNGLCGTVTFGTHTAAVTLPPVTDPAAIYPPDSIVPSTYIMQGMIFAPVLGLPYTIQDGKIQGQRATFQVAITEIFNPWCSVQTAYSTYGDSCTGFSCVPGNNGYLGTNDPTAQCSTAYSTNDSVKFYDTCARVMMCGALRYCTCNVDHCVGNRDTGRLFDLTFNNGQVTGTLDAQNVVISRVTSACLASGVSCNVNSDCCGLVCDSNTGTCQ